MADNNSPKEDFPQEEINDENVKERSRSPSSSPSRGRREREKQEPENEGKTAKKADSKQSAPAEPGKKVYIGRIPRDVRTRDVEEVFSKFGKISHIDLKSDFGFVTYEEIESSTKAIEEISGKEIDVGSVKATFSVEYAKGGRSKDSGKCFDCGRSGHWARECPDKRRRSDRDRRDNRRDDRRDNRRRSRSRSRDRRDRRDDRDRKDNRDRRDDRGRDDRRDDKQRDDKRKSRSRSRDRNDKRHRRDDNGNGSSNSTSSRSKRSRSR